MLSDDAEHRGGRVLEVPGSLSQPVHVFVQEAEPVVARAAQQATHEPAAVIVVDARHASQREAPAANVAALTLVLEQSPPISE